MLAWFEAQGKKRPRSPDVDGSENEENPKGKVAITRNEHMLLFYHLRPGLMTILNSKGAAQEEKER